MKKHLINTLKLSTCFASVIPLAESLQIQDAEVFFLSMFLIHKKKLKKFLECTILHTWIM